MNTQRWREVERLFEAATALSAKDRRAFVVREAGGDEALAREVIALLDADSDDSEEAQVAAAIAYEARNALGRIGSSWTGRRLGPWIVGARIGEGGMSTVFEASRADSDFTQRAAVKVLRAPSASAEALARFRLERQILAALDHPNIARLLDGGETPEGAPYIVMEFVDGRPLVEYAIAGNLDRTRRLKLFLQVLAAVSYAHQNLVLHRDLKPRNILVTSDGRVKLLDFGIAKLLEPGEADQTRSAVILTPEYASPEQIRGESLSTATDVYSLGVVLYELLRGERAFQLPSSSALAAATAALNATAPVLGVDRDLDTIVAKAMNKEPSRRYASVDRFADDVRRYLDGLPVLARPDSLFYRARKFARRNAVALALGSIAAAGVFVGTAAALHQAHRAQHRFDEVRGLAHKMLFDFDDRIAKVPGNTETRRVLLETAREYLDKLAADARDDEGLEQELAAAYDKVADVYGSAGNPNLGNFDRALELYDKSAQIAERLVTRNPTAERLAFASKVHNQLAILQDSRANRKPALEHAAAAEEYARRAMKAAPGSADSFHGLARVLIRRADMLRNQGAMSDALAKYREAENVVSQWLAIAPNAERAVSLRSMVNARIGRVLYFTGDLDDALPIYEAELAHARAVDQRLGTPESKRDLMAAYFGVARVLGAPNAPSLMRYDEATAQLREALRISEELAAGDASDTRAQTDLAQSSSNLAFALLEADPGEALRLQRRAIDILGPIVASGSSTTFRRALYADSLDGAAQAYARLGRANEAGRAMAAALERRREIASVDPTDVGSKLDVLETEAHAAQVRAMLGDAAGAEAALRLLLPRLQAAAAESSSNISAQWLLARSWMEAGRLQAKLGRAEQARASYTAAATLFEMWRSKHWAPAFAAKQSFVAQTALADLQFRKNIPPTGVGPASNSRISWQIPRIIRGIS